MNQFPLLGLILTTLLITSCSSNPDGQEVSAVSAEEPAVAEQRIISVNGALSEIIAGAGFADDLVGVDVTSTYPESVEKLPKIGHNRNIKAEGVISLNPTLVLANEGDLRPEVESQLKQAGVTLEVLPKRAYTIDGTKALIQSVADLLGAPEVGQKMATDLDAELATVEPFTESKPKVLFIYARGAGTLMVAGDNTQMESLIELAGGENAVSGFESFKPLTPEALVLANPDLILMFSSGVESLDGIEGVKQIPGMEETNAFKNEAYLAMDGSLIAGFGPRLGIAVRTLNEHLHQKFKS